MSFDYAQGEVWRIASDRYRGPRRRPKSAAHVGGPRRRPTSAAHVGGPRRRPTLVYKNVAELHNLIFA